MFDDEADMVPQGDWASEDDVPAIDVVLNHRLREDTSQSPIALLEISAH